MRTVRECFHDMRKLREAGGPWACALTGARIESPRKKVSMDSCNSSVERRKATGRTRALRPRTNAIKDRRVGKNKFISSSTILHRRSQRLIFDFSSRLRIVCEIPFRFSFIYMRFAHIIVMQ